MARANLHQNRRRGRTDGRVQQFQFGVVVSLVTLVPTLLWRPGVDIFALPKATLIWLGAFALLVVALMQASMDGSWRLPRSPWSRVLAAFGLALALATIASPLRALSVWGEFERYSGLLTYLSAISIAAAVATFDTHQIRWLLRWAVIGGVVPLLYGVVQWADLDPWNWTDFGFGGVFSTFGNSNLFAGYAAIVTPIAVWVAVDARGNRRWQALALLVAAAGAVGCFAARSFQGPVALAAGLGVLALYLLLPGRGRRPVVAAAAVVVLAITAGAVFFRGSIDAGLLERRYFWQAAATMIQDEPILGVGLDGYGQYFLRDRPSGHAVEFGDAVAEAPHNVVLTLAVGGGLLLGVAYLAVLVVAAVAGLRLLRSRDRDVRWLAVGLIAGWTGYLVQSTVSLDVPSHVLMNWTLMGGLVALVRRTPEKPRGSFSGATAPRWAAVTAAVLVGVVGLAMLTRPLRADLQAGAGYRLASAGQVDGGLRSLRSAIDLAPWRSRYWLLETAVLEGIRAYEEALPVAVEAAEREPGSSEYAVFVARLANQVGNQGLAEKWYREALLRNPHSTAVLNEAATWASAHDEEWAEDLQRQMAELA